MRTAWLILLCLTLVGAGKNDTVSLSDLIKKVQSAEPAQTVPVFTSEQTLAATMTAAKLKAFCEKGDEDSLLHCMFTFSQIEDLAIARVLHTYTQCATADGLRARACARLGVPKSMARYAIDLLEKEAVCKTVDTATRCEFKCTSVKWDECREYLGFGWFERMMMRASTHIDKAHLEGWQAMRRERKVEAIAVQRRVYNALMRHGTVLAAFGFMMLTFLPYYKWVQVLGGVVSCVMYASDNQWLQLIATLGITYGQATGLAKNVNNPVLAGIFLGLQVAIPVIHAASDVSTSTLLAVAVMVAFGSAVYLVATRRFVVDAITVGVLAVAFLNILHEYNKLIEANRKRDPFIAALAYVLNALLPMSQLWTLSWATAADEALLTTEAIEAIYGLSLPVWVPAVLFGLWYVLYFIMRGTLGMQITFRMKGLDVTTQFLFGILLAFTDVFAIFDVFRYMGDVRHRRYFNFAVASSILQALTFLYAPDLTVVAVIGATIMYVSNHPVNRIAKVLALSAGEVPDGAFRCLRAMPWMSIHQIRQLADAGVTVVGLDEQTNESGTTGGGVLLKHSGLTRLFTIQHVIEGKKYMRVHSDSKSVAVDLGRATRQVYANRVFRDPVVGIEVSGLDSSAADVPLLSVNELRVTKMLVCVHRDGAVTFCGPEDYKFDAEGIIHASVNLTKGDSGSPVYAVLSNGHIRYAGAVTRGTSDAGHQNMIASVVVMPPSYSPGLSESVNEVTVPVSEVQAGVDDILSEITSELKLAEKETERKKRQNRRKRAKGLVTNLSERYPTACGVEMRDKLYKAIDDGKVVVFNRRRAGQQISYEYADVTSTATPGLGATETVSTRVGIAGQSFVSAGIMPGTSGVEEEDDA